MELFANEIKIMRKFDHPNIIKLHSVYETEQSIYMVIDALSGGSLLKLIQNQHKFTIFEIKSIANGIAKGLLAMHQKQIIHCDIKPENILFRRPFNDITENNVVIADLGISSKIGLASSYKSRCGTPGYIAPEIINAE